MGDRQSAEPRRDLVPYGDGLVPDWWAERVAICVLDGGLDEKEARRVANAEGKRRAGT